MPIVLGDTTITGLAVGGLPNGVIGAATLANSTVPITALGVNRTIVQVQRSVVTGRSAGSNSFSYQNTQLTGTSGSSLLSVSITPKSSESLMWVVVSAPTLTETSNHSDQFFGGIWRNNTGEPLTVKAVSNRYQDNGLSSGGSNHCYDMFLSCVNYAGTTSAITYSAYFGCNGGAAAINGYGSTNSFGGQCASSITVYELYRPVGNVVRFDYTGSDQTWTVPSGVTSVTAYVWGAAGGGSNAEGFQFAGGPGGFTYGTINTTDMQGQNLTIKVGQGGPRSISGSNPAAAWPNGGKSGRRTSYTAGFGGGRSEITFSGTDLIITGAGGGAPGTGGSSSNPTSGGPGGGTTGGDGWYSYASFADSGRGGTQSAGGANGSGAISVSPSAGYKQGGSTNNATTWDAGGPNQQGGGGDGYYGGGVGGPHAGGGGGSSYVNPTFVSNSSLERTAATGERNWHYPPGTSSIYYNGTAGRSAPDRDGNNGYVVLVY